MNKFVLGDVHGTHKALVQVLERSGFDYEKDLLVTIGDIVDGYGDTYMAVEELLKIKNRIDIVGNHDDWFFDFIETGIHPDGWAQGGLSTAESYAKAANIELKVQSKKPTSIRHEKTTHILNLNPNDIPDTHKEFFRKQNKYYIDEDKNVFVHGGFMRSLPIGETHKEYMMWDRALFNQALSAKSSKTKLKFQEEYRRIFIGHTTTQCWNTTEPMRGDIVWNVDTGAGGGGKLTIMNVDTEEYWQSDNVRDLYPDDPRTKKFK